MRAARLPEHPAENDVALPTFSVIIPTFNEAEDIGDTLDAVLNQRLPAMEIIVVDGGSTDGTLELLRRRAESAPIVVIDEGRRRGVAAARNTGIRAATGSVVVILNADVMPEPGFLERLTFTYRGSTGMVSVNARVMNLDAAPGRYLQAEHSLLFPEDRVGWTEGFSCRREAALAALFPEEIPGLGGEDVEFFERLRNAGTEWKVDYTIVVPHRVPGTMRGFWRQWRWRGNAIPYIETRLRARSLAFATVRRAGAAAASLFLAAMLLPNGRKAYRRALQSPRGMRDLPVFWVLLHMQVAAHRYGEWQTLRTLWRDRRAAA